MSHLHVQSPPGYVRNLLWIDCMAGASVGVLVLALSAWLSGVYGLPVAFLWFLGAVNLTYGCYSFSLALRQIRRRSGVYLLIIANGAWAALCIVFAALFWETATPFGIASLVAEAIFVGTLARLEWRWRHQLITAGDPSKPPRTT